jgi:hypothetical protein
MEMASRIAPMIKIRMARVFKKFDENSFRLIKVTLLSRFITPPA